MTSGTEISPGSPSPEHALSQQELGPKVRGLFNDFKQTLKGIPEFQKELFENYFSPLYIRDKKHPLPAVFDRGLDNWRVKYFLGEENRNFLECLEITVISPSELTRGFRSVTLRMPHPAEITTNKADIFYNQRSLVAVSPTDIHQNNTASAVTNAEQMLVDLKATPA